MEKMKLKIEVVHGSDFMEFHAEPHEREVMKREIRQNVLNVFDLSKFDVEVRIVYEANVDKYNDPLAKDGSPTTMLDKHGTKDFILAEKDD